MSKTSPQPSSLLLKRLAYVAASIAAAAGILALAQTRSPHAGAMLRPSMLVPGASSYWHTEGSQILDRHDRPVHIAGVNWSGLETKQAVPGGLDAQDYRTILNTIKQNGFNTVRIPFSNEIVELPTVPGKVRFQDDAGHTINNDLRDLSSMEILDKIIAEAGKVGLKVILDNHRSEAGSSAEETGLWYTPQFPESAWVEDWTTLARRYQNNSTVIGMDLRNEPHNAGKGGACWDCGGEHDWHLAAQRAGNAVLAVNPRLLIFVEGVDSYGDDTSWWGGNLEGVRRSPVRLSIPGRLVYSAHEYGPAEYPQPWFNPSTSSATLTSLWRRRWAYISEAGLAPVWIGEFGTPNTDTDIHSSLPGSEGQWFSSLVDFLRIHPGLGWTYWGINGEDRYGLLDANYAGLASNRTKMQALRSIGQQTAEPAQPSDLASQPDRSYQVPAAVAVRRPTPTSGQDTESAIAASIRQAVRTANLNVGNDADTGDR